MGRMFAALLLGTAAAASLFVGAADITPASLLADDGVARQIFFELRLPRLLLALSAGALLAVAGGLFQTLFRNALMTPYTLGLSGGAVLGTGIATVLGVPMLSGALLWMPLSGFAGALMSVLLLLALSSRLLHRGGMPLLLLGIALSFFFSAALTALFAVADTMQSYSILRYTMGTLSTMGYASALSVTAAAAVLTAAALLLRRSLGLLGVGEEHARTKGVDTRRLARTLLLTASLAVGVQVAATGPIGFVGLVVPHMVRILYRRSGEHLILPTALYGALFLAACDTLSRLTPGTGEIPIGVVTAFVGGPFFIYLILKQERI